MLCCKSKISPPAEDKPPQVRRLSNPVCLVHSVIHYVRSIVKVLFMLIKTNVCVFSPLMWKRWSLMQVIYSESIPSTTPQLNSAMPNRHNTHSLFMMKQDARRALKIKKAKTFLWLKLHIENNTSGKQSSHESIPMRTAPDWGTKVTLSQIVNDNDRGTFVSVYDEDWLGQLRNQWYH